MVGASVFFRGIPAAGRLFFFRHRHSLGQQVPIGRDIRFTYLDQVEVFCGHPQEVVVRTRNEEPGLADCIPVWAWILQSFLDRRPEADQGVISGAARPV